MATRIDVQHDSISVFRLRPGKTVTVGRDLSNAWKIRECSVSRFHAKITWARGEPRPRVTDLGSSNGTFLDDNRLPTGEDVLLTCNSTLRFGELEFALQLSDSSDGREGSALLAPCDDQDTVVMRGDANARCSGQLRTWQDVRALLERLESEGRSGVLSFGTDSERWEVELALGAFALTREAGLALLTQLRQAGSVEYRYTPELQVGSSLAERWPPSRLLGLMDLRYSQRRGKTQPPSVRSA